MSQAAALRAKLSRAAVRWALTGVVVHRLTVARIVQALVCPGRAANAAVLTEGERSLINDPARCDGVRVIGVDEHVWRYTPDGDTYVTVILDLTPIQARRRRRTPRRKGSDGSLPRRTPRQGCSR